MSRVDIWVLGFEPGWSETPTAGLRRVFELDPQEAMTLELTVPTPVKRVEEAEAATWVRALRSIGAEVEERPAEAGVPPAFDLKPPSGIRPISTEIEGVGAPGAGLNALDGPPGLVMPSEEAKARAKAELAQVITKKQAQKRPPSSGAIKEEVHRVIRTVSTPQDRRPPPARPASAPADESAAAGDPFGESAAAGDPFGELDLDAVAAATTKRAATKKKKPTSDAEPALELEDVQPARRLEEPGSVGPEDILPVVPRPSKGRELAVGGALVAFGLAALYVGVMRFESSLLGTGSYLSWILDAVGFGALLYGLVHVGLAAAGREPSLDPGRLAGAAVVGFGIAYGIALLRAPTPEAMAALERGEGETTDARALVAEPRSRLADTSPEEASAILDAAYEGGAVQVEAAHMPSFLGRRVAHLLVIELPASGGARAHMAALIRRALGPERATLAANLPSGELWVLPLRP